MNLKKSFKESPLKEKFKISEGLAKMKQAPDYGLNPFKNCRHLPQP